MASAGESLCLVSWNEPEVLGDIPDTEWVCPMGSLEAIAALDMSGEHGPITDDDLRELAGGRTHHAELLRYPEGYHAVQIVDTESGAVLLDSRATVRYDRVEREDCVCGRCTPGTPIVRSFLDGRTIALEGGKEIQYVRNMNGGTETTIGPTEVGEREHDYLGRIRSSVHIKPPAQELYISAEGPIGELEGMSAKVVAKEESSRATGKLLLWVAAKDSEPGAIQVDIGPDGQVCELAVSKNGFLRAIGVQLDLNFPAYNGYWADVTSPNRRQYVLDATAEALALGGSWRGIDLRRTASGLYAAMGQRNLDPAASVMQLEGTPTPRTGRHLYVVR